MAETLEEEMRQVQRTREGRWEGRVFSIATAPAKPASLAWGLCDIGREKKK